MIAKGSLTPSAHSCRFPEGSRPEKEENTSRKGEKCRKMPIFHHTPQNAMPLVYKSPKPDSYATEGHFGSRDVPNCEILWNVIFSRGIDNPRKQWGLRNQERNFQENDESQKFHWRNFNNYPLSPILSLWNKRAERMRDGKNFGNEWSPVMAEGGEEEGFLPDSMDNKTPL